MIDLALCLSNLTNSALELSTNLVNLFSVLSHKTSNFTNLLLSCNNLNQGIFKPVLDEDMSTIIYAHARCYLFKRALCL